jgi:hypothetical protein
MQITRTIKGHTFSVQLRAVERAGELANGAPAYTAHVTIYRDGRDRRSAGWGGECFVHGPLAMADVDDSEDVYRELAVAIRAHLAATYARAGERVRRESDYVEMPAEDTSHPVKRLIAARMADRHVGPIVSVLPPDEATTSMQRVTFAPGLRGDELRCMASTARLTASRMAGVLSLQAERRAWCALADALDAAAERAEAGNAPEAP